MATSEQSVMVKRIVNCMNFYNLPMGICSVIVGCMAASYVEIFEIVPFVLSLIFVSLLQIGVNLQNNYSELHYHKHYVADVELTGKLMTLTENDELPLKVASFMFISLAFTIGLGLGVVGRWPAIVVGIIILVAVYFYNNSNNAIRYSRLAPLVVWFFYGPVAVMGCFFLETYHSLRDAYTAHEVFLAFLISGIMGIYAENVWLLRERMRSVILPGHSGIYVSRISPRALSRIVFVNTILIFVAQTVLVFVVIPYSWAWETLPVICLAGNFISYRKSCTLGRNVSDYRAITLIGLANMIFYTVAVTVSAAVVL